MLTSALILLQKATDFSTSNQGHTYNPPNGPMYYIVLIGSSLIVLAAIYYSVKWLIWPGEKSEDHIKRRILDLDSKESDDNNE